jgi:predicted small secreted protein
VLALCAACALAALSGCYTVAGFGKDLESLGDGIEDTALDIAE